MTGSKIKRCQNRGKLIILGQVLKEDYIPLHGYTLCVLNMAGVAFEKKGPKLKYNPMFTLT
jgi:hypothetical protein